ncbi:dihydrolipoyl dehydrogenase [Candidatus Thorarchaeota archaeon]|nr:MAG: dihydrolipoyl dehydrogenase [Candidatus Thorarchaeota archaeon]
MKEYDLLVVGGGAANKIAEKAHENGLDTALIEKDALLGTCVNEGCVPSKMLIHPADVIRDAQKAERIDISLSLQEVRFSQLMERIRARRQRVVTAKTNSIREKEGYDLYEGRGVFIDDYQLEVNDEILTADQIVIATGARPSIPPIDGIEEVDYLTNRTLLELKQQPNKLIIIGGGYIGVEYAHFFSAIGTDVTIIGRSPHLIKSEDRDVCQLLKNELSKRVQIYTGFEAKQLLHNGETKKVIARDMETNDEIELMGDTILIATGRTPSSDITQPEKTGVKTNDNGFIIVDEYMRTSKERIWATGDATGNPMFKHVADEENRIAWMNIKRVLESRSDLIAMDYSSIPLALFTKPEVARVGMTLREAQGKYDELAIGTEEYAHVVMGEAMGKPKGFCRIIVDRRTDRILGATIIGPHASILMQSIINVIYSGNNNYQTLRDSIYIHPSLSKIVRRAALNIK